MGGGASIIGELLWVAIWYLGGFAAIVGVIVFLQGIGNNRTMGGALGRGIVAVFATAVLVFVLGVTVLLGSFALVGDKKKHGSTNSPQTLPSPKERPK